MRAAFVEAFGDASAIRWGELPDPQPGPDEVLVAPEAVAVDMVDTYVRSGRWQTPVTFPLVVGRDLAGVVVAAGDEAAGVSPGDRVWTGSAGYDSRPGATAELVAVQRDRLYALPQGADPASFVAAVHPMSTAYGCLVQRAGLRRGDAVTVLGAGGAVGMCAVQVTAAHGAEVTAVLRHADAGDRLRELGAAHVRTADVAKDAGSLPAGIDILLDTTGALDIGSVTELMAQRGRIILLAGRHQTRLDQWAFYTRELQLIGFVMSGMTAAELQQAADWANARHPDHPVHVSIGRRLGLADAARAHQILEAGQLPTMPDGTRGRIVLLR